jgi:hypothetical protein
VGSLSAFVDRLAGDAGSRVLFGRGCKGRVNDRGVESNGVG